MFVLIGETFTNDANIVYNYSSPAAECSACRLNSLELLTLSESPNAAVNADFGAICTTSVSLLTVATQSVESTGSSTIRYRELEDSYIQIRLVMDISYSQSWKCGFNRRSSGIHAKRLLKTYLGSRGRPTSRTVTRLFPDLRP